MTKLETILAVISIAGAYIGLFIQSFLTRKQIAQTEKQILNQSSPALSIEIITGHGDRDSKIVLHNASAQLFDHVEILAVVAADFDENENRLVQADCASLQVRILDNFEPGQAIHIYPFRDLDGRLISTANCALQDKYLCNKENHIGAFAVIFSLQRNYDKRKFYKIAHYRGAYKAGENTYISILPLWAAKNANTSFVPRPNTKNLSEPSVVRCRKAMTNFCKSVYDISDGDLL